MHAKFKSLILATLVGGGLLGLNTTAQAQSYKHVHGLVSKLERQLNILHREVDTHFRPTPYYAHLHDDVEKMENLARHIHQLVDDKASIHHILADVRSIDRSYHHIRELVNQMSRTGQIGPRTRLHFNQTLRAVGNTIHHLRDDLEELVHGHHHHP